MKTEKLREKFPTPPMSHALEKQINELVYALYVLAYQQGRLTPEEIADSRGTITIFYSRRFLSS